MLKHKWRYILCSTSRMVTPSALSKRETTMRNAEARRISMRFLFDHALTVASRLPLENYYDILPRTLPTILQSARAKCYSCEDSLGNCGDSNSIAYAQTRRHLRLNSSLLNFRFLIAILIRFVSA